MAKSNRNKPNRSKPYDQKIAQRQAVKRAMRTGGELGRTRVRPDTPQGMPNPNEEAKNQAREESRPPASGTSMTNPSAPLHKSNSDSLTAREAHATRNLDDM